MRTDTSPMSTTELDPTRTAVALPSRPTGRHAVALAIATLFLLPLVSACGITSQTEPASPPSHGHVAHGGGGAVTHPHADENEANENERDENEPGDRVQRHRDRHPGEHERDEKDNESDENESEENEQGD